MRYLKTYESFREPINREDLIETLYSTSTFEREELESMTDDELEDLYHSLETEDWLDELDREDSEGRYYIGGPYHSREEEEGDYYEESYESITKNLQMFNESSIYIPVNYNGIRMELGEDVDSNDIIDMYNQLVASEGESIPLVGYSEYGTEGKFYNENDDEIPLDVILDELNYAIGLGGEMN